MRSILLSIAVIAAVFMLGCGSEPPTADASAERPSTQPTSERAKETSEPDETPTPERVETKRSSKFDYTRDWPVISVEIDPEHLTGPEGLLTNPHGRGRTWERPARVTLREGSKVVLETGVGARLHGGSKRNWKKRMAFRLYFRAKYGTPQIDPGVVFDAAVGPIRTLVIRWETQWFASPMSYEIARRIGVESPVTRPVVFELNGAFQGPYYILPHMSERQMRASLGHDRFELFRHKSGDAQPFSYSEMTTWAKASEPLDLEAARERIDLDNLSRYLIGVLFCGTNDWTQGATILDRTRPPPHRWRWINWDMDHSFVDYGASWKQGQRPAWQQETIELLLSDRNFRKEGNPSQRSTRGDIRKIIFTRFFRENDEFRRSFLRLATELLNHRLTAGYLSELDENYKARLGPSYPKGRSEFLENRPAYLREELGRFFEAGPPIEVHVETEPGLEMEIDGHPETGPWRGQYYRGQTIEIKGVGPTVPKGWKVGGKIAKGERLSIPIERRTTIKPRF